MTQRIVWILLLVFLGWQGWRYLQARASFVPPPLPAASAPAPATPALSPAPPSMPASPAAPR